MAMALWTEWGECWRETLNWEPTAAQQEQLQRLYAGILAGNQRLNLTRLTEPGEFWEKHLWDSLSGVAALTLEPGRRLVDIGTGGGFPGLAIAIFAPQVEVTLLDATRKKLVYLAELVSDLGLSNVQTLTGRAEALGQERRYRATWDLALARAVGPAAVCAEYGLPLLKVGGMAVLYRGQWSEAESQGLAPALGQLGGELESVSRLETPLTQSLRHCLYVRKVAATPAKFPRAIGIPRQHPLA
ncbi:MAG: 16S rRNA (guanine(527)-N(7))-methyltransferase RsmG [Chloroflexaceae bacterium]|nr:16S rRNA (guanine(527)-N(7))-methyltransferase RsmG [Chloroflexaceae bacterium]